MPNLVPKRYRRRSLPWATTLILWDIWRRLPPAQRKLILAHVRRHGPRVARYTVRRKKR